MYACVSIYLGELLLVTVQNCCYMSQLVILSFSADSLSCHNSEITFHTFATTIKIIEENCNYFRDVGCIHSGKSRLHSLHSLMQSLLHGNYNCTPLIILMAFCHLISNVVYPFLEFKHVATFRVSLYLHPRTLTANYMYISLASFLL